MKNKYYSFTYNKLYFFVYIAVVLFCISTANAAALVKPRISCGGFHTIVLKSTGTVWAWGLNWDGELGDGSTTSKNTPVQVKELSDIIAVTSGFYHSAALKSDGTVWVWGDNSYGQLGDGTKTNKTTPFKVSGVDGVIAIAAGYYHTIALKEDGTVWAWGNNTYGQLGDDTTIDKNKPTKITAIKDIVAIASGYYHTIALRSDGAVWTWGNNIYGQLGNGNNNNYDVPIYVKTLSGRNVIATAGGLWHTVAMKLDGTVWTYGNNFYGQLGDKTNFDSNIPVLVGSQTTSLSTVNEKGEDICGLAMTAAFPQIPVKSASADTEGNQSTFRNIIAIAAGGNHTVCIRSDGSVWTFGSNFNGQLGNDSKTDSNTPVQVSNLSGIITAVSGGYLHTVAMRSDGTVWAWGNNYNGQLGDGTYNERTAPVQVNINLGLVPGKIFGKVIDISNNEPIVIATLNLTGKKGKVSKTTYSDANGYFEFANLRRGYYIVTAKKEGYIQRKKTVKLERGGYFGITMYMLPVSGTSTTKISAR